MMFEAASRWVVYLSCLSIVPLGLAWIVSRLLVRSRAAVRHHVWVVALGIVLSAPVVTVVAPRIDAQLPFVLPNVAAPTLITRPRSAADTDNGPRSVHLVACTNEL
jgi:hypothetical protein